MKIPRTEIGMRTPTFEKKSQDQLFFLLFWLFLSEILSRRCQLSQTTRKKRSCSNKWKNSGQNCVSHVFRRKCWHDFVTPFSTFANIKGSLPTNLTTPDRLRCRARPSDEDFPGFWPMNFSKIAKKKFFFRARHLLVLNFWSTVYTPKEARSRIFVTGGQYSRDKCWRKKIVFRGGNSSYTGWGWSLCPTQRILETRASGTVTRIHIDTVNTVVWSRHRFNMY